MTAITEEMVEAMASTFRTSAVVAPGTPFRWIEGACRTALTAAYPLIARTVKEQAAKVADNDRAAYLLLANDIGYDRNHQDIKFTHLMCVNAAANIAADIRAMPEDPP